jgi:NAD-dependent dihydropyrimidine dehydrogenase PreA subunit
LTRLLIRFDNETVEKPVTSEVILEHRVPLNILSAKIDQDGGEILAEVAPDRALEIIAAFKARGVSAGEPRLIEKDDELCIDCGACVSLCPVNAYTTDWEHAVVLDPERCLGSTCGLCIESCPREALSLK